MAYVEISRRTPLKPEEAFARITDWEAHRVPLTRIHLTPEGFVARTGAGPIGFDDPMTIVRFERPRFVKIEKTGSIVRGWAEIEVRAEGDGALVHWREEVRFPLVPAFIARVLGYWMLNHILSGLLGGS